MCSQKKVRVFTTLSNRLSVQGHRKKLYFPKVQRPKVNSINAKKYVRQKKKPTSKSPYGEIFSRQKFNQGEKFSWRYFLRLKGSSHANLVKLIFFFAEKTVIKWGTNTSQKYCEKKISTGNPKREVERVRGTGDQNS